MSAIVAASLLSATAMAAAPGATHQARQNLATAQPFAGVDLKLPVIFDQGPTAGSNGGCWSNDTDDQNFADNVTLPNVAIVKAITIFTCEAPVSGAQVHFKVLLDDGGAPGAVYYQEDGAPSAWVASGDGYAVTYTISKAVLLTGGVSYWCGLSGNGFELGQYSVLTPGDGQMAQFSSTTYGFMTAVGDQMFQLVGLTRK